LKGRLWEGEFKSHFLKERWGFLFYFDYFSFPYLWVPWVVLGSKGKRDWGKEILMVLDIKEGTLEIKNL
jgi:hypothetical protein